ncbi:hypothetical protein CB0940_03042 [Cercospora beticola]|uniref:Uncharacterized protein n=1 Tax=Cercospora beticola TaxID=122368 RepID=A0A2G5I3J9_CERBT|nr:hypothetical protein CB0940_03042 [Cercospora beticola]PIA99394.1 hypothetical protein CB0940_03042 [Cercospora beticola]WPB00210.1 hypothetical protein RHO25_004829 [Cercospora beticola]CAK1361594.1 unnamed protein product [Cercospora beticola]
MAREYGWRAKKYQEGRLLIKNGQIVQGANAGKDSATTAQEDIIVTTATKVFGIFELLENIAEFMDGREIVVLRRVNQTFNFCLRQPKFDQEVTVQQIAYVPAGKGPRSIRTLPQTPKVFKFLHVNKTDRDDPRKISWSIDAQLEGKYLNGASLPAAAACDLSRTIHVYTEGGLTVRVRASSSRKGAQVSPAYAVPANLNISLLHLMELTHEWIDVFFNRIKGNCSFVLHVVVKEESEDPDDAWSDADLPMA